MKTKVEKLTKFLNLINISGSISIRECIIKGTKKSLSVYAKTPSNTFALKAILKGDYSELETVGIDDLALLRKVICLNKNDKEIEIVKKENTILIKNNNIKTKLLLRNPKYILTALEDETYEEKRKVLVGNSFTLTKENISQLAEYYDVMKGRILISGKDDKIIFKMGLDENVSEITIEVEEKVKPFEIAIEGFFVEALKQMNSDVLVNAKTDLPMIINAVNKDIEVEYLLAPLKRDEKK